MIPCEAKVRGLTVMVITIPLIVGGLVALYAAADRAEGNRYEQGCEDYGKFTHRKTQWNKLLGCIDETGKTVP